MILVLGPTASGKTLAAVAIARAVSGEIVSGDAYAVYRGLDVGTSKPSLEARSSVAHHLIDVADPWEPYSAGRWASEARAAVEQIEGRRRVPIVAGGSHFYLRALLEELPGEAVSFPPLRAYMASRTGARENVLRKRAIDLLDPAYSAKIPSGDTARLSRALEIVYATGRRVSEREKPATRWATSRRVLKFALQISREDLYTRIDRRIMEMWRAGWPREVEGLLARNVPITSNCFRAIGYREIARFLAAEMSEDDAIASIVKKTRLLAKRQRTWLASEPDVAFVRPEDAVECAVRGIRS